MRTWLIRAFAAALAVGCGGGGGGSDEGSGSDESAGEVPSEVPLAEFFAAAEASYCEYAVRCRGFGDTARCRDVLHFEDRLSMRAMSGVGYDDPVSQGYLEQAVEVGRIDYDAAAASACLAYVQARTCEVAAFQDFDEAALAGQEACRAVFTGRMDRNGPCAEAIECAGRAVCGFDPSCAEMCCVGACRVLPEPLPIGEPCTNPNVDCVPEAFCAFDPNTGMATVCTARTKVGGSCEVSQCEADAYCEYDGQGFTCLALPGEGEDCLYNGCAAGLVCATDPNWEQGTCVAPAEEGEPCVKDAPQNTCRRFDNRCDPGSGRCAPLPDNGESCTGGECRGDLFCSYSQGQRCRPVADAGEPCDYVVDEYIPCSGDHTCVYPEDGGTPTCAAPTPTQCPVPEDPLAGGA